MINRLFRMEPNLRKQNGTIKKKTPSEILFGWRNLKHLMQKSEEDTLHILHNESR